ncbi:MAG: hypothetical protein MJZ16_10280, partial [Bacteroidales bacterium]|nr:hypothetical protein [Bacteroidales bacterium]
MILVPLNVFSQNNVYRIDDECYDYYLKAQAGKNDPNSINVIDAMYNLAVEKGDKKAETISYVLRVQFYFERDDIASFEKAIASLKENSLKTGYTQYYYYAYSTEVTYLLNQHMLNNVIELASKMHEDAESRNDDFGFWMTYKTLATIHTYRKDYSNAKRCYQDALIYSAKVPSQSTVSIYLGIANLYDNPDSSLFYLKQGLDAVKTPTDSITVYKALAFAYGAKDDYTSYGEYKSKFDKMYDKYKIKKTSDDIHEFEFYNDLTSGNYSKALAESDSIEDKELSLKLKLHLSLLRSDFKNAYGYLDELTTYRENTKSGIAMDDIVEVNAKFNNNRLRAMNDDLIQSADAERMKQKNNFYTILFASIFVILFVIADFTLVYIKEKNDALEKERSLAESLKASKEEAEKSKEAAIKANNMKTSFVQNMSHEIRTPLNAIVGFSQLMSLPEGFVTDEEKKQYGSYITSNSNLLMMLIDDILNISDVENGNYKLDIKPSNCNEM